MGIESVGEGGEARGARRIERARGARFGEERQGSVLQPAVPARWTPRHWFARQDSAAHLEEPGQRFHAFAKELRKERGEVRLSVGKIPPALRGKQGYSYRVAV
jgi:hypothetical protein